MWFFLWFLTGFPLIWFVKIIFIIGISHIKNRRIYNYSKIFNIVTFFCFLLVSNLYCCFCLWCIMIIIEINFSCKIEINNRNHRVNLQDCILKLWRFAFRGLFSGLLLLFRAILTENVHRVCKNTWFLYACMLCFHVCFDFMFAQLYTFICYQTCKLSEHSKIEFWFNCSKNGIM